MVLSDNGYVKITDFGIAKIYQEKNSYENSGTPGYMAPEVLNSENYSYAADYFAVGVLGYEFMKGYRPYRGKGRREIQENILSKQAVIKKEEIPQGWSLESADFINRLLQRKPKKRLGARGATEIKEHSWFKYYAWKDLYLQKLKSPFIPKTKDNFDEKYCNNEEPIGIQTIEKYIKIISSSKYKKIFNNFKYFNREENDNESQNTNYVTKRFKNPHLVYYENNENNENDYDASIINRNILNGNNMEKELYSQMKKLSRLRMLNELPHSSTCLKDHKMQSRNKNTLAWGSKTGNKGDDFRNSSLSLSFLGGIKKLAKESGFGY